MSKKIIFLSLMSVVLLGASMATAQVNTANGDQTPYWNVTTQSFETRSGAETQTSNQVTQNSSAENSGMFYDANTNQYYRYYVPSTGQYTNELPESDSPIINDTSNDSQMTQTSSVNQTSTVAPGVPNTGAGGKQAANLLALLFSGLVVMGGVAYLTSKRSEDITG